MGGGGNRRARCACGPEAGALHGLRRQPASAQADPQEVRASHPEWDPANVDVTKNPMLAPTLGEALAIRKARKAARRGDSHD